MNATETYQANRHEIDEQIARIQDLLRDMDKRQSADPKNWGFAGSAEHVSKELEDVIGFLWDNK
jgi:hypothetical protein